MDIHIHLTDGKVFIFRQENQKTVEAILKSIHSKKLFSQPQIIIQGGSSTSGFACSRVELIEFITEIDPGWTFSQALKPLALISEQEHEMRIALEKLHNRTEKKVMSVKLGTPSKVLLSLFMRSGKKLFGETTMVLKGLMIRLNSQYALGSEAIYGKRNKFGHIFANTQNIIQWGLNCGLPNTERYVWQANRLISP